MSVDLKKLVDRYAEALNRSNSLSYKVENYEELLHQANQIIYEAANHTTNDSFYDRCLKWENDYKNRKPINN